MSINKGIFELDFLFFILLLVAMVSATGNLRKLDRIYTFKEGFNSLALDRTGRQVLIWKETMSRKAPFHE